jgi:hypothetical protein
MLAKRARKGAGASTDPAGRLVLALCLRAVEMASSVRRALVEGTRAAFVPCDVP